MSPRILRVAMAVAVLLGMAAPARSQSATSSTIHGVVVDESAGTMPGVTVTLTSPALQLPSMVTVTGGDGSYRFVELPAGTYKVTYELSGFLTLARDEVRIPVGFTARLDATMKVGAVSETVVVSGQGPVVDLTTTTASVNLTQEALETIPRGRGLWETVAMAPGVTTTRDAPDVGDSNLASRSPIANYGVVSTGKIEIEGVNVTTGTESNAGVYLHSFVFDEVQIKASGNDAEVSVPGVNFVAMVKSGANNFKGDYQASWQGPSLQSSNLNDTLRSQGLSETERLKYYYDVAGDLGGRILRDKLWFYGGLAKQQRVSGVLGFAESAGPDGQYLTPDDVLADSESSLDTAALKLSWQATPGNRLIGVWTPSLKYQPQRDGGRFRPLESTLDYRHTTSIYKIELQSMLSPKALFNVVAGYGGYSADYSAVRAGFSRPDNPSRQDRETTLRTGPAESPRHTPRYRTMLDGSFSFFPERRIAGKHEMKAGWSLYWETTGDQFDDQPHGNYVLIFDRVGGVANQPVEIQIRNWPIQPENRATVYAGYLKDVWRINGRLTANVGLRWEQQNSYVPPQGNDVNGQFPTLFPGGTFPKLDVLTWTRVVPRAGIAWSLTGSGKSVVKATWGLYNAMMGDGFAGAYNLNGNIAARFRWNDLNRNRNYDPGEVNLSTSGTNPDFISISGGSSNVLPTGLQQPVTTEVTLGFERELRTNLAFRSMYVFKQDEDQYGTVNTLRPFEAYNVPITRRDPGPDGVLNTGDDGGRVTFFDYAPAYRGAAFVANKRVNSRNKDHYQTVELTMTKRMASRWMGIGSVWFTKNHRWINSLQSTPNDAFFPLDETWNWAATLSGSYLMPFDIMVSGFMRANAGLPGYRTYTFRSADPDGGPPIAQLSTVTLPLEEYGAQRGPSVVTTNIRAAKQFALGAARKLSLDFDVFNVFNSSAAVAIDYLSGPTSGYVTDLLQARVARLGVRFSF